MVWAMVWGLWGCGGGQGGSGGALGECLDPVVVTAATVDCAALADGVTVAALDQAVAYRLPGADVTRTGDVLTGTCVGQVTLTTTELDDVDYIGHAHIRTDAPCGFAEADVVTCTHAGPQEESHDPDVVALTVEAETVDGWAPVDVQTTCNRMVLPCDAAGQRFRVVRVWSAWDDVGQSYDAYWQECG